MPSFRDSLANFVSSCLWEVPGGGVEQLGFFGARMDTCDEGQSRDESNFLH